MEFDIGSQAEFKRAFIYLVPALGEFGLQAQLFIGAQQGVVNQIADAHGIGVGGVTRIELSRIGLDADDQKIGRNVAMGRTAAAANANEEENQDRSMKVRRQEFLCGNFD